MQCNLKSLLLDLFFIIKRFNCFVFTLGNDENSEKDSFLQDENSNSAFDINEDSNMTSFNGDETNDGEELENSFDSHAVEGNEDSNMINNDSEQNNEDSQAGQHDGEDSNVATSVVR